MLAPFWRNYSKVQNLIDFFGIQNSENLYQRLDGNTPDERIKNAVNLYVERLEDKFQKVKKFGYSAAFPIVSLEGENKYYLVFAASHPKAVILASETVYSVERNRPHEVQAYLEKISHQPSLFPVELDEEQISKCITQELATAIWNLCAGKQLTRAQIYMNLLNDDKQRWFGRFSGSHFNRALASLLSENSPRIIQRSGAISQDNTMFEFRSA